jgi:hypothetical protein
MTTYTAATLPEWAAKIEAILDAVTAQATAEMLADIKVTPGINRGGGRQHGTVPRDLGALARSLQSTLYGSTSLNQEGVGSHVLVAGAMKAGDTARFSWGGAVAPYAAAVHYGARGVPGTFWIDVAAAKWPGYVAHAVDRAKAALR